MWSSRSLSSLQKTYDESYLKCSTAVYYETQGDEKEAMLCWKNALEQIRNGTTGRKHGERAPRSDNERTLFDSLRELECQCQERIDLLEALRLSRQDLNSLGNAGGRKSERDERTESPYPPSTPSKGWIGDGTIPAITYPELSRTPLSQRPHLTSRSMTERPVDRSTSIDQILDQIQSSSSSMRMPSLPPYAPYTSASASTEKGAMRPPSPDKRTMRTTLRSNKSDKPSGSYQTPPSKTSRGPGASKAATLAWSVFNPRTNSDSTVELRNAASQATETRHSSDQTRGSSFTQQSQWDSHTRRLIVSPIQSMHPIASDPGASSLNKESASRKAADPTPRTPSSLAVGAASSALNALSFQERTTPKSATKQRLIAKTAPSSGGQPGNYSSPNSAKFRTRSKTDIHAAAAKEAVDAEDRYGESPSSRRPLDRHRANCDPEDASSSSDYTRDTSRVSLLKGKQKVSSTSLNSAAPSAAPSPSVTKITNDDDDKNKDWQRKKKQILKSLPAGVDESAAKAIFNEIVVEGDEVHWSDVAGLEIAKNALREAVVYPFLRPDLFMGLREPARGMLLFGPPGTGKTMLARAVATESKSTFFSISASSLTSKYLGESEKLVRALFALARVMAPSIIFVDEIDSLLSQRSGSGDHETTRRIKTEFLIQWSDLQRAAAGRESPAAAGGGGDRGDPTRVLVLAATNLPWAIDEAARRRFVRRQYIPLPEPYTRATQLKTLLGEQKHNLTEADILELIDRTDGFSGSDITALAKDAAMGPLRSLGEALLHMKMEEIRPIEFQDFVASLRTIRPSVDREGLKQYEDWAKQFGERGG
ncbi:P-loop containing nucleoside triphosphate hydrolase protein [Xylaria sp. CBS 124048]|nr:P-loop containing nucleoside triphosphate hydrolase protein [Xylaria sp. CBS 124048]